MKQWTVLALIPLAGCMSIFAHPDTRMWQRLDGRRMASDPALQQQFYQAQTECIQTANQQPGPSISQNVTIGRPQGVTAGDILAANQARRANDVSDALFASCMGGRGYKLDQPPQ